MKKKERFGMGQRALRDYMIFLITLKGRITRFNTGLCSADTEEELIAPNVVVQELEKRHPLLK